MTRLVWMALLAGLPVLLSACSLTTMSFHENANLQPVASVDEVETAATVSARQTAEVQVTQTVEAGDQMIARLAEQQDQDTESESWAGAQPDSGMPAIKYFECQPCTLEAGQEAILEWEVTDAITVTLDGEGVVSPGSAVVRPDQSTAYRLSAFNENGRSEKTLVVELPGIPVIHHFTCLPCEIYKGEVATLSWDLSGGTAVYLDGQGVPAPGTVQVAPDRTTSYRLEAVGEKGSVTRLVTISIKEGRDLDAVRDLLSGAGYRVLWAGFQAVGPENRAAAVVMQSVVPGNNSNPELLDQCFRGLKVLYDNFPNEMLSVGLYDGSRYVTFVTVSSKDVEALLRAETDSQVFWSQANWSAWDEWKGVWLVSRQDANGMQDYFSKDFLH
jgi:hypothetical protein